MYHIPDEYLPHHPAKVAELLTVEESMYSLSGPDRELAELELLRLLADHFNKLTRVSAGRSRTGA